MCPDCNLRPSHYKRTALCRICHNRRWRLANPEKYRAQLQRHRERHRASIRTYQKGWRDEHRDEERERQKRWVMNNPERRQQTVRDFYWRNRQSQLDRAKDWHRAHPECGRAASTRYAQAHPEEVKKRQQRHRKTPEAKARKLAYDREWRANNRGKVLDSLSRRRANKVAAFVERVDPNLIYERDRGICQICGKRVQNAKMSIDHIVPLSQRGSHQASNVQLAHKRCNSARGPGRLPAQTRLL